MILKTGFLLDGYPRTIDQAHALDKILADLDIQLDAVIQYRSNPDSLLERLSGRIIHRETGKPSTKFSATSGLQRRKITINVNDKPETKTSFGY